METESQAQQKPSSSVRREQRAQTRAWDPRPDLWAPPRPHFAHSPVLSPWGRFGSGRSGAIRSGPVRAGRVRLGPVRPGQVRWGPVRSGAGRSSPLGGSLSSPASPAERAGQEAAGGGTPALLWAAPLAATASGSPGPWSSASRKGVRARLVLSAAPRVETTATATAPPTSPRRVTRSPARSLPSPRLPFRGSVSSLPAAQLGEKCLAPSWRRAAALGGAGLLGSWCGRG